ncbi:FAD-dependent oxidoreductase [Hyphomicrobium sp. ghe19]|uniref:NAD(P)/FAD-dependent oxidoreductase n=1 Tax=Hyphomicrobium sp. ghe19 TaxID=2682968 RepID=UPI0030CCDAD1
MSVTAGEAALNIAVIGSGIAGMSAAWLLSQRHVVTLYEQDRRIGGHSNSVPVPGAGQFVDTGFIVFNELNYPNLTALFKHLKVQTQPTEMSLAVSLRGGGLEYSGKHLGTLFAQPRNIVSGRFWSMLRDLRRFYQAAPLDLADLDDRSITLGEYLDERRYGTAFREDHLLPMAGAIWSAPPRAILDYPAASFIRFHDNHGLLKLTDRPVWRTVTGGSRNYVEMLTPSFRKRIHIGTPVTHIRSGEQAVFIRDATGDTSKFDHVVIASHADQALALLVDPSREERTALGSFRYSRNRAVLHSDTALMPKRRSVWSSWNYIGAPDGDGALPTITYWMNRLQSLRTERPLFLTLNPRVEPRDIYYETYYEHPLFNSAAIAAQRMLWPLQGQRRLWFCGSYFGYGFHEDGLQAGLAVVEQIDPRCRRPWSVDNESGRIFVRAIANSCEVAA